MRLEVCSRPLKQHRKKLSDNEKLKAMKNRILELFGKADRKGDILRPQHSETKFGASLFGYEFLPN